MSIRGTVEKGVGAITLHRQEGIGWQAANDLGFWRRRRLYPTRSRDRSRELNKGNQLRRSSNRRINSLLPVKSWPFERLRSRRTRLGVAANKRNDRRIAANLWNDRVIATNLRNGRRRVAANLRNDRQIAVLDRYLTGPLTEPLTEPLTDAPQDHPHL